MHGFTTAADSTVRGRALRRWQGLAQRQRWLILLVLLPTALVAAYLWLVASDQYVSEAHFEVRSSSTSEQQPSGLGQVLGLVGGVSQSQSEAMGVGDYLLSHDAVEALERRLPLRAMFRRAGTDPVSRLRAAPTAEQLLRYYRGKVSAQYDSDTGITTLRVRSFAPQDAHQLAETLLTLGEQRVNFLNRRLYDSSLTLARQQLTGAEEEVRREQGAITALRQTGRDVDPERSATAQLQVVSSLRGQLALARAALASASAQLAPGSPQLGVLRQRASALAAQVGTEDARLAGSGRTIAAGLGRYEEARLRQDFAAKRYAAAAAALQQAREQTIRQQLFIVRIVEPNMPNQSLYPQRWTIVLTCLAGLLLAFGIGWLIVAGFREHAA